MIIKTTRWVSVEHLCCPRALSHNKKYMYKKRHNTVICDPDLKVSSIIMTCCHKQFNLSFIKNIKKLPSYRQCYVFMMDGMKNGQSGPYVSPFHQKGNKEIYGEVFV